MSACGVDNQKKINDQDLVIKKNMDQIKNKFLVMSGKGGVGKSSVAVNLAAALAASGKKTGLLDVDLHGPSIARMLGLEAADRRPDGNPEGTPKKSVTFCDNLIIPALHSENLVVISMDDFLNDQDEAVIWRGPIKISAIRQFLSDVKWGELDYLIIDSPPGTGDEPLTIAQTVTGSKGLIVTTPQEAALRDVRKSINFCKSVKMEIIGLIENMSGFACPHCGEVTNLFNTGGGETTAKEMNIPFLGRIPIIPEVVVAGDEGKPALDMSSVLKEQMEMIVNNMKK